MKRLSFPLSVLGLAILAACATEDPVRPAPAPVVVTPAPVVTAPPPTVVVQQPSATAPAVVAPTAIRAGHGRIESLTALPPSAAAGGTTTRRVGLKMDDGTVQYLDTAAQGLAVGDRVEITGEGNLRR